MKGIILAGGAGTRLWPITRVISKQLLPIYDKPMVYYPMSVLMMAGIREILIISTPQDLPLFQRLFGNGDRLGLQLSYAEQAEPRGLAEAFTIGRSFIGNDCVAMVLGDNIFYGDGLERHLLEARERVEQRRRASIFGYRVSDPERYGVAELGPHGELIGIEEKPKNPKSYFAVTGLYFYPNEVVNIATEVQPSRRGELEITSINEAFLKKDCIDIQLLGRGYAWLDTGTHASLAEASTFIEVIEKRQGQKIACLEEIAFRKGFISGEQLWKITREMGAGDYARYLLELLAQEGIAPPTH